MKGLSQNGNGDIMMEPHRRQLFQPKDTRNGGNHRMKENRKGQRQKERIHLLRAIYSILITASIEQLQMVYQFIQPLR